MNKEIIQDALLSALSLLNIELESVEDAELSENYLQVIEKIENGLKQLN